MVQLDVAVGDERAVHAVGEGGACPDDVAGARPGGLALVGEVQVREVLVIGSAEGPEAAGRNRAGAPKCPPGEVQVLGGDCAVERQVASCRHADRAGPRATGAVVEAVPGPDLDRAVRPRVEYARGSAGCGQGCPAAGLDVDGPSVVEGDGAVDDRLLGGHRLDERPRVVDRPSTQRLNDVRVGLHQPIAVVVDRGSVVDRETAVACPEDGAVVCHGPLIEVLVIVPRER